MLNVYYQCIDCILKKFETIDKEELKVLLQVLTV